MRNHVGKLIDRDLFFCLVEMTLGIEAEVAALVTKLVQAYSDIKKIVFEYCNNIIVKRVVNDCSFGDVLVIKNDLYEIVKNGENLKAYISKYANDAAHELCNKLVKLLDDKVLVD